MVYLLELQKSRCSRGTKYPIIFMAAHDNLQWQERAIKAGALAILIKPLDESALLDVIKLACEKREWRKKPHIVQNRREEQVMKKRIRAMAVVAIGLAFTFLACAQQKGSAPKPGGVAVEVIEWSGKVTAVDYPRGTVSLQGRDGKVVTLNAKYARNLDQVKVGDVVEAEYIEELAIYVRKADSPPGVTEEETVELAPKGAMPAGFVADTVQITANVEAINYQTRTVTLKGAEGTVRTVKVGEGVKNLDQVKVGDQVVLRITEAFAIAVVKP